MASKDLTKPFTGLWRARAYVAIAALLWIVFTLMPKPFSHVVVDRQWWHTLIDDGIGSIDKFAYLVFLAGIIYAVVSDILDYMWNNNISSQMSEGFDRAAAALQRGVQDVANGISLLSLDSVKSWIVYGKNDSVTVRSVAEVALFTTYGDHHRKGESIIDYMMEDVLDKFGVKAGVMWENLTSQVTIRSSNVDGHFQWEEEREYTIVCDTGEANVPVKIEVSFQIRPDTVQSALDNMEYWVKYDSELIVDFRSWWNTNKTPLQSGLLDINADGVRILYDGSCVKLEIGLDRHVKQKRTLVTIFERSYISTDDRCYSLAIRHPTRNLRLGLTLELPDWIARAPVTSADLYESGRRAVRIEQNYQQKCSANVVGWNLPGIAAVVEWLPKGGS